MSTAPNDFTLAQQLSGAFTAFGAIVGTGFIATALTYAASGFWLTPEFDRSRLAAKAEAAAHAAMLDQENGLRGYLLTHDVSFLEPYTRARDALARANEALTQNVGSATDLVGSMIGTRIAEEQFIERWANAAGNTGSGGGSPPSLTAGKALFDAYRRAHAAFATALDEHSESLNRRQQRVIATQIVLVLAAFMVVFLLAVGQHRALRDTIVVPIAALLHHIGRVRDGHLDTALHPAGPRELRQLGEGLNEMACSLVTARQIAASREGAAREHSARLRQILDATRAFSESLKLEYVVEAVRQSAAAVGGYEQVIMWLMHGEEKQLVDYTEGGRGAPHGTPPALAVGDGLAGRAARTGRITFEDSTGQVRFIDSNSGSIRALAIPLIVDARVIGALEARHNEAQLATRELIETLELLATHAATAIESARLHATLERRSQIDTLTQLFNRGRLDEDILAECQRCVRYGRPLALVMLDIDHFKAINDTYGHPKADTALQQLAAVIVSCLRTTDTAYRYGGEEFCVLMRETSAEDAMHFAERARQRIEQRFTSGELVGITASFGVAGFSADTPLPASLLAAADEALYESKHAGRNRVFLSSRPRRSSIPVAVITRIA
jgi:diguanylate cyclase (GGDEF)-like protein